MQADVLLFLVFCVFLTVAFFHCLHTRNLLYTAVTRAKKCVTIVGSEVVFEEMIANEKQQKRFSSLHIRLRELEEFNMN